MSSRPDRPTVDGPLTDEEEMDRLRVSDVVEAERARKILDACSYSNLPRDDIAREITGVDCSNQYTGGQDF